MRKLLALVLMLSVAAPICLAREIVVNSTADRGAGTLRWALQTARSGDVLTFDSEVFPPTIPATIYPQSGLPPITCGHLTIDASNAGVIVDATLAPESERTGLLIFSDDNTIRGLQIVNCYPGAGMHLEDAQHNTIGGCRSTGAGPTGQGNLLSGNGNGITMSGPRASSNTITGNLIGTNVTGEGAWLGKEGWGNFGTGIYISWGASHNVIGPSNVIAYNREEGVQVYRRDSMFNTITRNSIHSNGVEQIYLNGGNGELPPPVLLSFSLETGSVEGLACGGCTVEVYSQEDSSGLIFEGTATTDEAGAFALNKGRSFAGPRLVATATDDAGNSSEFCPATFGSGGTAVLQEGNGQKRLLIRRKPSASLRDNRIGVQVELPHAELRVYEGAIIPVEDILAAGYKWLRLEVDKYGLWWNVDWRTPEGYISRDVDAAIDRLAGAGVQVILCLGAQDTDIGVHDDFGRFKNEQEVQQYLKYLAFLVGHFGDRVAYHELWNEPEVWNPDWRINLPDYISLIHKAASLVETQHPTARIAAGSTTTLVNPESRAYLLDFLKTDVLARLASLSWHPFYGTSPEHDFWRDYYYEYPALLQEIKEIAARHGFRGVFVADELSWPTPTHADPNNLSWNHSPIAAAKLYARGIALHLGLGVVAEIIDWGNQIARTTVSALCNVMAGHEAIDMPVEIVTDYEGPLAYCAFRYVDGDRMLAVWTDGIAQDEDPGVAATILFPGLTAGGVKAIDVLHGFEQELVFETRDGSTKVRDLLVKDFPILLRLSDVRFGPAYEETVGDGFHRIGDIDAANRATEDGVDCDGDGVPDEKDLCPDWPGSLEASGC